MAATPAKGGGWTAETVWEKSRPVAGNETAAGRQMNRRVELVITDLDAQP